MQWFYAQGGQQIGPSEENDFQTLVRSGVIRADTLVWHQGMPGWQPLGALAGYTAAPPVPAHYGGFWIRALARLIDGVILSIPSMILLVPLAIMLGVAGRTGRVTPFGPAALMMQGVFFLISGAVSAAYETYFVSTRGATPGKMALGLKIVRTDGSPLPVGLAFGRYLAQMLSGFLLIGYLMAAFDTEKRSLHDRICGTRVVYAR